MASLIPNGMQRFFDGSGNPLAGGKVYFYAPGSTEMKDTWADPGMLQTNPNPVVLDARGEATIWGYGAYRQVLKTSQDAQIWDKIVSDLSADIDQLREGLADDVGGDTGAGMIGYQGRVEGAPMLNLRARTQERFSLKSYAGAALDGVTDDTDSWNEAIEWLASFEDSPTPVLDVPSGVSIITEKLTFNQRFLRMQGAGLGRMIGKEMGEHGKFVGGTAIRYDGPSLTVDEGVLEFSAGATRNRGIRVADLSILCNHHANGIYASGADMAEYDRLYIDQPLVGMVLNDSCYSSVLRRIEVFDPRVGAFDLRASTHATSIELCRMNNLYPDNELTSETPQFGVRVAQNGNCSAVKIDTCSFDLYRVTTHIRMVNASRGFTILNPYIECRGDGVTGNAVVIQACEGLAIIGGRITKGRTPTQTAIDYGVQLQGGVNGAVIQGLQIAGFDRAAVRVASGAKNYLVGPNFTGGLAQVNDQNPIRTGTVIDQSAVHSNDPGSGTYTPTLVNTTNVAASSATICQYSVLGNVVSVSGLVSIQPAALGAVRLDVSLPVDTTFRVETQASGVATTQQGQAGQVTATVAAPTPPVASTFGIAFNAMQVSNQIWTFMMQYRI